MSDVTSFEVTGDWRHIVDDGMVDGDNLPDEVPLTGKVVFKPVYPTVATAGVPVTAYTLGPVTALVAGGVLTDLQGRPGVMLAGKVGEHTVRWSAETSLRFQEQKVDYPRVTFDLTEDVRLTGIITQAGPSLTPIVVDPRIEALAASVESVNLAVVEAEGHASDAAGAVTLAGQEADRAVGLANAQDEHIAGTLENPASATHAAFKAVGNATYETQDHAASTYVIAGQESVSTARSVQDPLNAGPAIVAAAQAADAAILPLTTEAKTYGLTTMTNTITLHKGLDWQGTPGAVIKTGDGAVSSTWHRMFGIRAGATIPQVRVRGLHLDGNARGNPLPGADPFVWQQAAMFSLGSDNDAPHRVKNWLFEDLVVNDPVADVLSMPTWGADSLVIKGMRVQSRSRTRSDITLSGFPKRTVITDFVGSKIEAETVPVPAAFTADMAGGADVVIDGAVCSQNFDWLVYPDVLVRMNIRALTTANFSCHGGAGTISHSHIHFPPNAANARKTRSPRGLLYDNVDFYLHTDAAGHIAPLQIDSTTGVPYATSVTFSNCRFHVVPHPDFTGSTFTGNAVTCLPLAQWTDGGTPKTEQRTQTLKDCWFDSRFPSVVRADRGGTVKMRGNRYDGAGMMLTVITSETYPVHIDADDVRSLTIAAALNAIGSIRLSGAFTSAGSLSISGASSLATSPLTLSSSRRFDTVAAPTGGAIRGDRAVSVNPTAGQPHEWVATATSATAGQWKATAALAA